MFAAAFAALVGAPEAPADRTVAVRQDSAPAMQEPVMARGVGDKLHYGVAFAFVKHVPPTIEALGIDTICGEPCYHVSWIINGGALGYHLRDSLQTWFGVNDLVSRRFIQDTDENGRMRYRHYEIYPERMMWVRNETDSGPTAPDPLDDASFFFFARTIPVLENKQTYRYNRYFMADRNPVTIRVLQRQNISVAGRRYRAVVVQPIFISRGMFGENGSALIWFADDSTRIPLRIRASLPIGTLEMSLRSRTP